MGDRERAAQGADGACWVLFSVFSKERLLDTLLLADVFDGKYLDSSLSFEMLLEPLEKGPTLLPDYNDDVGVGESCPAPKRPPDQGLQGR